MAHERTVGDLEYFKKKTPDGFGLLCLLDILSENHFENLLGLNILQVSRGQILSGF